MKPQLIDLSPRRSGKTWRAIRWLRTYPDGLLVTIDDSRREWLAAHFQLTDDEKRRVATFSEFMAGCPIERLPRLIYIDDADYLLSRITPCYRYPSPPSRSDVDPVLAGFSMSNDIGERFEGDL